MSKTRRDTGGFVGDIHYHPDRTEEQDKITRLTDEFLKAGKKVYYAKQGESSFNPSRQKGFQQPKRPTGPKSATVIKRMKS